MKQLETENQELKGQVRDLEIKFEKETVYKDFCGFFKKY